MEKLQLDTKGMHLIDGTDAFQQVKPGFPGESEDQMDEMCIRDRPRGDFCRNKRKSSKSLEARSIMQSGSG